MTNQERSYIMNQVENASVEPSDPMKLSELKIYLKGFEDARNAMMDAVGRCYLETRTD